MKKVFLSLFMLCALFAQAAEIERIEPACWWVDMKNPELQIMVYGKNIAHTEVSIDYPGVRLKEVVRLESANYLFLYLDISEEAKAGSMNIQFTDGKQRFVQSYELRERNQKTGAQGFSPADVMYLITPDRFANADPKNDNLDSVKVDRSRSGARHGGDIRGIINKLDYIKDLGFTTIWLNPVLENRMPGGSYHGYAITDFYQVDPRFGSNEEYCELIDKAHDRGIKVVMDMIFNHCGSSHWWLKDFPSKDWLNHQDNFVQTTHFKWTLMDVHAPQSEKDILVNGWFTRGMPDLNQRNPHLARYLIQNSIWWIEYARIDGIRQDTHPYADYDFMCQWCKEVLEEYPDFKLTIIDSKCASVGYGLVVERLLHMQKNGAPRELLLEAAEFFCAHMEHAVTVMELGYLFKGGRLSKTSFLAGTVLDIKPIIIVDENGSLKAVEKVRGWKKAQKRILDMVGEKGKNLEKQVIGVCYGTDVEAFAYLKKELKERYHVKDLLEGRVGCAIGAHTGPGILGIVFLNETNEKFEEYLK